MHSLALNINSLTVVPQKEKKEKNLWKREKENLPSVKVCAMKSQQIQ